MDTTAQKHDGEALVLPEIGATKRAEIARRSLEEFQDYLKGIPEPALHKALEFLHPVNGFRKDTPAGLQARIRKIHAELRTNGATAERAWHQYLLIRFAWLRARPAIQAIVRNVQRAVHEEGGTNPESEGDPGVRLFEILAAESATGAMDPDDLDTLYRWDSYPPNAAIEAVIRTARVVRTLRRERPEEAQRADGQPDTALLAGRIGAVEARLADLAAQGGRREAERHGRNGDAIVPSALLEELRTVKQQLQQKVDPRTLKVVEDRIEELRAELRAEGVRASRALLPLAQEDAAHRGQLAALRAELAARARESATSAAAVEGRMAALEGAVAGVLEGLRAAEASMREWRAWAEGEVATLLGLIDRSPQAVPVAAGRGRGAAGRGRGAAIVAERLTAPAPDRWTDERSPRAQLFANLKGMGLSVAAARGLAGEVFAGLACGQLVVFRGSLASPVARLCASTFACGQTSVLHIPVGLLSGAELAAHLAAEGGTADGTAPLRGLLLEGLNRSAFEVYGTALHDLIAGRLLRAMSSGPLLFGSLVEGPGVLPASRMLCELGPVLDVDALEWQPTRTVGAASQFSLTAAAWASQLEAPNDDVVEDLHRICSTIPGASRLWGLAVAAAGSRLAVAHEKEQKPPTPLQSLAFGWIIPYALATGTSAAEACRILRAAGDLDPDLGAYSEDYRTEHLARVRGEASLWSGS